MLRFVVPTWDLGVNDSCSRIDKENRWNCIQGIYTVDDVAEKPSISKVGGSKQLHTSQTTKKNTNTKSMTQLISAIFGATFTMSSW